MPATKHSTRSHASRRRSNSHRASATKPSRSSKRQGHQKESDNRWSGKMTTASTAPPKDLYTKDAKTIAGVMATKRVSPKGLGSANRIVQFYINRAGTNLPATRKHELEKAKELLQERAARKQGRYIALERPFSPANSSRAKCSPATKLDQASVNWSRRGQPFGRRCARQGC
jgi:hypothetical protein